MCTVKLLLLLCACKDLFLNLFADDAKIFSLVSKKEDCITLQQDLDKFNDWIGKWLLSLNVGKC